MRTKIIFLAALIFLASAFISSAEGPIACDIFGYISHKNGSSTDDGTKVNINLAEKSMLEDATRMGPPPSFIHGFYGVAFSRQDDCNYGDLVYVKAESGSLQGGAYCYLSEYSLRDLCNITLESEESIQLEQLEQVSLPEHRVYDCVFSGYVIRNGLIPENKIQVSIEFGGKAYVTTTRQGPPPEHRNGYYYMNLGNFCRENEIVSLKADDGVHSGTKITIFNSEPSLNQYNLEMDKRSSNPELAGLLRPSIEEDLAEVIVVSLEEPKPIITQHDMYIFSLLLVILVLTAWIVKLNWWNQK